MAKKSITESSVNEKIQIPLIVVYDANKNELQFATEKTAKVPYNQGISIVKVEEHIVTIDDNGKITRQNISKDGNER